MAKKLEATQKILDAEKKAADAVNKMLTDGAAKLALSAPKPESFAQGKFVYPSKDNLLSEDSLKVDAAALGDPTTAAQALYFARMNVLLDRMAGYGTGLQAIPTQRYDEAGTACKKQESACNT